MYHLAEYQAIEGELSAKKTKTIVQHCISLINLLEKKGIYDDELDNLLEELLVFVKQANNGDKTVRRSLDKKYNEITNHAKVNHKLILKGSISGEYMMIFMAIGIAIGAGLASVNAAFIGIGLPIGLATGLAIGGEMEKKAGQENRVY